MNFNFDTGLIDTIQTLDCTALPALGGTVGVLTINGTGALLLPQGVTGQRPTGVAGMFRYNQSTHLLEYFDGTTWDPLSTANAVVSSVGISTSSSGVTVGGGPITSAGTLTVDISAGLQNLSSLAAGAGTGFVIQTGTNTFAHGTIASSDASVTIQNGSGATGTVNVVLPHVGTPVTSAFVQISTDAQGRVTATSPVASSDITTALGYTPINKAGDSGIGSLSFASGANITMSGGGTVTGLPTPSSASDAVPKSYVDSLTAGLNVHGSVEAATVPTDVSAGSFVGAVYAAGAADMNSGHGIGATLTAAANNTLLSIDGYTN